MNGFFPRFHFSSGPMQISIQCNCVWYRMEMMKRQNELMWMMASVFLHHQRKRRRTTQQTNAFFHRNAFVTRARNPLSHQFTFVFNLISFQVDSIVLEINKKKNFFEWQMIYCVDFGISKMARPFGSRLAFSQKKSSTILFWHKMKIINGIRIIIETMRWLQELQK